MKLKVHFINGESKVFTRNDFISFKDYMKQVKEREQKPWLFFKEAPVRTEHVLYIEEVKETRSCINCKYSYDNGIHCKMTIPCYKYSNWKPKED